MDEPEYVRLVAHPCSTFTAMNHGVSTKPEAWGSASIAPNAEEIALYASYRMMPKAFECLERVESTFNFRHFPSWPRKLRFRIFCIQAVLTLKHIHRRI